MAQVGRTMRSRADRLPVALLDFMRRGRVSMPCNTKAGTTVGVPSPQCRYPPTCGMIRFMKASNSGTVKAVSPCAGL
jgi:hypothetical protein